MASAQLTPARGPARTMGVAVFGRRRPDATIVCLTVHHNIVADGVLAGLGFEVGRGLLAVHADRVDEVRLDRVEGREQALARRAHLLHARSEVS